MLTQPQQYWHIAQYVPVKQTISALFQSQSVRDKYEQMHSQTAENGLFHYLCHYPELITQFGPLIHLWTMRFESKQTYFKQYVRKRHNFKNLCATLVERLLQVYLSAENLFQLLYKLRRALKCYSDDYNDQWISCSFWFSEYFSSYCNHFEWNKVQKRHGCSSGQ